MGLSPVFHLWKRALCWLLLAWLKWARHDLQLQDPSHPDLGYLALRIRELESP